MRLKLESDIKSIELSYLFAKNLDHGFNKSGEWKLFEPSKFIYSFFALNMIYEINWNSSIRKKRLWEHRKGKTHTKLYFLIEFIYKSSNSDDFQEIFKDFGSIEDLIRNCRFIENDPNIDNINHCEKLQKKDSFLNNYLKSINNLSEGNFSADDHYNLIAFTYQIRNNIFHGVKTVGMMTLREQRERLIDYTNIVLTTLEMFFKVLKKKYDYYGVYKSELDMNLF